MTIPFTTILLATGDTTPGVILPCRASLAVDIEIIREWLWCHNLQKKFHWILKKFGSITYISMSSILLHGDHLMKVESPSCSKSQSRHLSRTTLRVESWNLRNDHYVISDIAVNYKVIWLATYICKPFGNQQSISSWDSWWADELPALKSPSRTWRSPPTAAPSGCRSKRGSTNHPIA